MSAGYPNKLPDHPMIEQITDALHAGQTPREVASWCRPPVSHTTIWKYQRQHVEPLQKEITESIEKFVAEHGHLPVLANDDDISEAELAADEWLQAVIAYKNTRIKPAIERFRRKAALELVRLNGASK